MTIAQRFSPRQPDTFVPARIRPGPFWLRGVGLSRLALKLAAVKVIGLSVLLHVTLQQASFSERAAQGVLDTLLVQVDTVRAALRDLRPVDDPAVIALAPPEARVEGGPTTVTAIDRDAVERVFADALEGTRTRAELYGVTGERLADSRTALRGGTDVATAPLPPLADQAPTPEPSLWRGLFGTAPPPPASPARIDADEPAALREVIGALGGVKTVGRSERPSGDAVVAVATPLFDADGRVVAALRVVSPPGAIDRVAREQERGIVVAFLVAAVAAVLLSMFLAATISRPLSRLARAAETIKRGSAFAPIPELNQPGEIGDLSRVLNEMTIALYERIDAIDAFADEVAHELKNPLTSLRSAVETMPLARTDESRKRLLDIIEHDVRRIDRLISDISDASKLDAELNRYRFEPVDIVTLLKTIVEAQDELARPKGLAVALAVRGPRRGFVVRGNDSRLGQVFTNLIENARSFSPEGATVIVTATLYADFLEVTVDDEGPGIDEAMMERIFERFYTDRPTSHAFGDNSGLGLAISRQVVEAHRGEIFAENRYRTTLTPERDVAGARLTVRLPTVP